MSALVHIHSDFDRVQIEVTDNDTIWLRTRGVTVSLNLSAADRAKLRAALDEPQQAAPLVELEAA